VLAVTAGLCFAAPRANASCAASHFSFGVPPLPFGEDYEPTKAPKHSEPQPTPCPCKGPHCHKVPADPTAPAPSTSSHAEGWAWIDSAHPLIRDFRTAWACRAPLFSPLFSDSPLEHPPR